jgi:tetratricopeptide (TPR) repeat protein
LIKGISDHVNGNEVVPQMATAPSLEGDSSKIMLIGFGLVALAILGSAFLLRSGKEPAPSGVTLKQELVSTAAESKIAIQGKPSIAVLPFDNLSPVAENAYFAAGIHEDILTSLSKVPDLKVISRTSVMRYADSQMNIGEITKELNVDQYQRIAYLDQAYKKDPGNLQVVMNIGTALHWLGDFKSAERWLDLASAIAPRHEGLLWRRADLLNSTGRLTEAEELEAQWLAQNPDSHQGQRSLASTLGHQASEALRAGELDKARRLRERSIQYLDRYLAPDRVNGVFQVKEDNIWGLVSYATSLGALGDESKASTAYMAIIDYYKEEQTLNFAHFHLTIAYALLGNTTKAIEHFARVPGTAFNAIWIIDSYRLTEDTAGIFHGLNSHPVFKETVDKIKRSNEAVLARVQTDMPHLLSTL